MVNFKEEQIDLEFRKERMYFSIDFVGKKIANDEVEICNKITGEIYHVKKSKDEWIFLQGTPPTKKSNWVPIFLVAANTK